MVHDLKLRPGFDSGSGFACHPQSVNRRPLRSFVLPLVSREWKNGSNSSYNCTPFLHSLLTKGKLLSESGLLWLGGFSPTEEETEHCGTEDSGFAFSLGSLAVKPAVAPSSTVALHMSVVQTAATVRE